MTSAHPALREELCAASRKLERVGLNCGTAGNLSVRVPGGLLVTPSGVKPEHLTAETIVAMGLNGVLQDPRQQHGASIVTSMLRALRLPPSCMCIRPTPPRSPASAATFPAFTT